ncbi:hypothetical protein QZM46_29405 [Burkholderia vietnamiensis]|uniref:hypothetical protein n=1 Tax=Burkholderia TaxID=32008 RepID=UPI0012D9F213|nr:MULTISPECIES: hypothetical protein [Burkholderia]MBR7972379.1 hypothetical protein [Burkholderia vietnamiensis]MDN7555430.1 hypothetical protein [Burkholderia vietnamiensis]QMI48546.1 hypothetical protein MBR110_24490 [Burkholderia sp. MBR-1]HDR9001858.1 hypothetical protein [Burkholderia vietnamiensis]HDR9046583.1 hypothetical protein [Burkholderia vietnamiensis]
MNRPVKHYVIALAVVLWLFMLVYALVKNPSATDASEKIDMMNGDMAMMLVNGGNVVYRNENAKFGGALLSVLIRTDSWSNQLRERDIKTLVDLGWQQISTGPASFCKRGVIAEIQENVGNYKNVSTVLISMKYNATTIKACK